MSTGTSVVNGQLAFVDQTIMQRQINRGVSGVVAYPLTRTMRVELGGGVDANVLGPGRSHGRLVHSAQVS